MARPPQWTAEHQARVDRMRLWVQGRLNGKRSFTKEEREAVALIERWTYIPREWIRRFARDDERTQKPTMKRIQLLEDAAVRIEKMEKGDV